MNDNGAKALTERITMYQKGRTPEELAAAILLDSGGLFIPDVEDFRDQHERAMRDHILETPTAHICDDLCSDHIVNRLFDHIGAAS